MIMKDYRMFIEQMRETAEAIRVLTNGISEEQARWRPDPQSWSILEVVNHLYDEEREDFRVRLDLLLHRPEEPWPPIDPQAWITSRKYNQRDLKESIGGYLSERRKSVEWLKGLQNPDFSSYIESRFGKMSAGDMFAAWAAHDLLHIRQLMELRYTYLRDSMAPYDPGYAGDF